MNTGVASGSGVRRAGLALLMILCSTAGGARPAPAAELAGARQVLQEVMAAQASTNAAVITDPVVQAREDLRRDIKQFATQQPGLSPEQAAAGWLTLFDRFLSLPPDRSGRWQRRYHSGFSDSPEEVSLATVVAALPGPGAWTALEKSIEARKPAGKERQLQEAALRMLIYTLTGSVAKLQNEVGALQSSVGKMDRNARQMLSYQIRRVETAAQRRLQDGSPDAVVRELEKALDAQAQSKAKSVSLKLPDLVGLVGEKRAEALIARSVATPGVRITVVGGKDTAALARRIVMRDKDRLREPQWGLVDSMDAMDLYEVLIKKFPRQEEPAARSESSSGFVTVVSEQNDYREQSEERTAAGFYLLGLIARNRIQDAVVFALALKDDESWTQAFGRGESAQDLVDPKSLSAFCEAAIEKKPGNVALWRVYVALAPAVGKTDEAIAKLKEAADRKGLTTQERAGMLEALADGYLSADRVDEGVAVLRRIAQTDAGQDEPAVQETFAERRLQAAERIATLGTLLRKPEWIEEGIHAAEAEWSKAGVSANPCESYESSRRMEGVCKVMADNGKYSKAEAIVRESMKAKLSALKKGATPGYGDGDALQSELSLLAAIYGKAGRYADVVVLLEQAPWWGGKDLLELTAAGYDRDDSPLMVSAARGLAAQGRSAEAAAVLKVFLTLNAGDDAGYQTLTEIAGESLIPWLDELYQRDRFEERPLIWKAHLLLKAGRFDDAEQTVREALRVDPTDGETKAGDRVRAYSVLADILDAKDKKEDAAFFRKVVESVRIAEAGDKLTEAGLIKRSLADYEKAQGYFADAYCVQWRMAERLYAMGDKAGAEQHYRIAFERMPEQFGQVASLCFGCQGVFGSEHSRSAAESVLLRLEKEGPKRPQVYFLLGQLREAQSRYPEAYAYFRKAVEMDPGYLDVWEKIANIAENVCLPQSERDAIALKMLRMDPLQRHIGRSDERITDCKGLWEALQENQTYNVPRPEKLLALTASKEKIEQSEKEQESGGGDVVRERVYYRGYRFGGWPTVPKPGDAIARGEMVQALLQLMACELPSSYEF